MKIHEHMSGKEFQEASFQLAEDAANGTHGRKSINADLRRKTGIPKRVRFTPMSGGKADIADWPVRAVRASVATA
jgi:hypothetical protein